MANPSSKAHRQMARSHPASSSHPRAHPPCPDPSCLEEQTHLERLMDDRNQIRPTTALLSSDLAIKPNHQLTPTPPDHPVPEPERKPSDSILEAFVKQHQQQQLVLTSDLSPPSLEATHQHLRDSYDHLAVTLSRERKRFQEERRRWAEFKRHYAQLLVTKLYELTNKVPASDDPDTNNLNLITGSKPSSTNVDPTGEESKLPQAQEALSDSSHQVPLSTDKVHDETIHPPVLLRKSTDRKPSANSSQPLPSLPQPSISRSSESSIPADHPFPTRLQQSNIPRAASNLNIEDTPSNKSRSPYHGNEQISKLSRGQPTSQKQPIPSSSSSNKMALQHSSPSHKSCQTKASPSRKSNGHRHQPQSCHRIKPQVVNEQMILKTKNHSTPQSLVIGRKRTNSSVSSSTRSKLNTTSLPKLRWIRYSDRKARKSVTNQLFWSDERDDDNHNPHSPSINKQNVVLTKVNNAESATRSIQTSDDGDVFRVSNHATNKQKHSIPKSRPKTTNSNVDPKDRPVTTLLSHDEQQDDRQKRQQQFTITPELSTTEESYNEEELEVGKHNSSHQLLLQRESMSTAMINKAVHSNEDEQRKSKLDRAKMNHEGTLINRSTSLSSTISSPSPSSSSCLHEEFPGQNYMRKVHKKRQREFERNPKSNRHNNNNNNMTKKKKRRSEIDENIDSHSNQEKSIDHDHDSSRLDMNDGLDEDNCGHGHSKQFEIDPINNFGENHIFDQVTRGKQIRKQMLGTSCECCSGYYEQAAKDLDSIQKIQGKRRRKTNGEEEVDDEEKVAKNQEDEGIEKFKQIVIHQHQNQISKHRHFNLPALTPPDYWQMGFPDTPHVQRINQRAAENQKLKVQNIDLQIKAGIGPYKLKPKNQKAASSSS